MTPLEQIKEGILAGDISAVALGYKSLTGEDLNPQAQKPTSKVVETKSPSMNDFIAPSKKEDSESDGGRIAKNSPIPLTKRDNLFTDNGVDHKDISTPDVELFPRQRSIFETISQECQKCHKILEVHPIHKRDHFICDRCIK